MAHGYFLVCFINVAAGSNGPSLRIISVQPLFPLWQIVSIFLILRLDHNVPGARDKATVYIIKNTKFEARLRRPSPATETQTRPKSSPRSSVTDSSQTKGVLEAMVE